MESSESDEDDYLPETPRPQFCRSLTKKKTWLPSNEAPRRLPRSRLGTHSVRSNSEASQVAVGDIRSHHPAKLRKNSCNCDACGGEKLAKRILFTVIPMQEIQRRTARISSLGALGTLIQNCRSGSFILPVIRGYRLSTLIKPVPHQVFVSPPDTPHLRRMLSSPSPRPALQKPRKQAGSAMVQGYRSPVLHSLRRNYGARMGKQQVHRATPSTTHSDCIAVNWKKSDWGKSGSSLGFSQSMGGKPSYRLKNVL